MYESTRVIIARDRKRYERINSRNITRGYICVSDSPFFSLSSFFADSFLIIYIRARAGGAGGSSSSSTNVLLACAHSRRARARGGATMRNYRIPRIRKVYRRVYAFAGVLFALLPASERERGNSLLLCLTSYSFALSLSLSLSVAHTCALAFISPQACVGFCARKYEYVCMCAWPFTMIFPAEV